MADTSLTILTFADGNDTTITIGKENLINVQKVTIQDIESVTLNKTGDNNVAETTDVSVSCMDLEGTISLSINSAEVHIVPADKAEGDEIVLSAENPSYSLQSGDSLLLSGKTLTINGGEFSYAEQTESTVTGSAGDSGKKIGESKTLGSWSAATEQNAASALSGDNIAMSFGDSAQDETSIILNPDTVVETSSEDTAGGDTIGKDTIGGDTVGESTTGGGTAEKDNTGSLVLDSIISHPLMIGTTVCVTLLLTLFIGALIQKIQGRSKQRKKEAEKISTEKPIREKDDRDDRMIESNIESNIEPGRNELTVGKVHHIGKRQSQQDSFGVMNLKNGGTLAVVADGMGGMADGDKYSQSIVFSIMNHAAEVCARHLEPALYQLISRANTEVNEKLTNFNGRNRGGSTLLVVLQNEDHFSWAAVGDSRIYLYRAGGLIQMNSEHTYLRELLIESVNRDMPFEEAMTARKKGSVTSFLGMGDLKYIDGSLHDVKLQAGDRILLMSDGIFNTLSEEHLSQILANVHDVQDAADRIGRDILQINKPKQDNFTAIILGWD